MKKDSGNEAAKGEPNISGRRTLPSRQKIDKEKALKLRLENGLSYQEIADHFGVAKSSVYECLKKYNTDIPESLAAFRSNKALVMEYHQARLLSSLTDNDIKRIAPAQRITAAAILEDKIRLERNQSTSNASFFVRVVSLACDDSIDLEEN